MPFLVKPGQKVLFTGDSITDCGRRAHAAPLGDGYVRMIHDLVSARHPAHRLTMLNTGISGNTVRDLRDRWTDDVIRYQPDWLSIMIGINDIHRWLAQVPGQSVSPQEFADLYPQVLERTVRETKARIVIVEPFYISSDNGSVGEAGRAGESGGATGSWRSRVLEHFPKYLKTVHAVARKYATRFVPLHSMFQEQLKHHSPDRYCPEPVHPNPSGHLLMAQAWLKEMGW